MKKAIIRGGFSFTQLNTQHMSLFNQVIKGFKTIKKGSQFEKKLSLIDKDQPELLPSIQSFLNRGDRESAIRMVNIKAAQLGFKTHYNAQEDEDNEQLSISDLAYIT